MQNRQLGVVLLGLAVLAALITWLLSRPAPEHGAANISSVAKADAPARETAYALPRQSTGAATRAAAPVSCPDQSIEIAIGPQPARKLCMGQTQTIPNGSVRTFRVEPQDRDAPVVNVDAAAGQILRAELVYADGTFSCLRDRCAGVSQGPYDAQGARSFRFVNAKLARGEETAVVNATLRTIPDDQIASTTCVGQLLYISVGEGTVHFCPDSGNGFQLQNDGVVAYHFINGDGITVAVRLTPAGALQSVEYGPFSCRSPSCTGASVSPARADGRRNFTFQGTLLTEGAGATTALLNGNLVLAPQ